MRIAILLIKWMIVAALVFTGIVLLLPNLGIDVAQVAQGRLGGNLVIAAAVFIDSFLGRLVLSAYTLALGALFILIGSFLVFYRT
jgi:hypothetical protein